MKITKLKIKNFRKLNNCSINLSDEKTLFVGANNSGKTSAMHALMLFLGNESRRFKFTDIPISHWETINNIGESWLKSNIEEHIGCKEKWQEFCPCLYVTLSDFKEHELPKIKHIIPDLSWDLTKPLQVCLFYEPKNLDNFKENFVKYINQINKVDCKEKPLPLPHSLREFLEQNINKYFSIQSYLVDINNQSSIYPLSDYPFEDIFKLSIIPAQRKFADSTDIDSRSNNLSEELSNFYKKHLNPKTLPTQEDINALLNIRDLQGSLTTQLNKAFEESIQELQSLGYPSANYDPDIMLESFIDSSEILRQNTRIKFGNTSGSSLPEELNGLGYRNLIYIFFKLLTFRAEWQKIGKASESDKTIEPIHLVLIEEPEAHLHSQVQQVFVKKAYEILTKGQNQDLFTTQIAISTHSSYIIHEIGFESLHYFKRCNDQSIFSSKAIDLSNVFNEDDEKNKKFVSRYLRTVHCDLFFANAIILVEGSAERMLLPYFIRYHFPKLNSSYISILEINGAHAHRFKPLIEALGVPTLVLTDLDPVNQQGKKTRPKRGDNQESSCDNLEKWLELPNRNLETVLDYPNDSKEIENTFISYQKEISIEFNQTEELVIPYTFEDSIVFSNIKIFENTKMMKNTTGMLQKMHKAVQEPNLESCCEKVFEALSGEKAKMALDILYEFDPNSENELFNPPNYIKDGLEWLINKLGLYNEEISDEQCR
ncbi:hypothetical protein BKK56_06640 [Rodentibacter genomosp. 2]|nr:hypothetical protein BKK56_06640 [Rodentibacter genomosp. 2]